MSLSAIPVLLPQSGALLAAVAAFEEELRVWMKSLRLHKYTDCLLGFTYHDFITLTDRDLQTLAFTEGAKGKLLKHLAFMRNRPRRIKELHQNLDELADLRDLLRILPEMEKVIMMPLRPHQVQAPRSARPITKNDAFCSGLAAVLTRDKMRRDSGIELAVDEALAIGGGGGGGGGADGAELTEDDRLPEEIVRLLEKTFGLIVSRQKDHDQDGIVLYFYRLVERGCLHREAFTPQHRLQFLTWLRRMDQVWDTFHASAAADLKAKRRHTQQAHQSSTNFPPTHHHHASLHLGAPHTSCAYLPNYIPVPANTAPAPPRPPPQVCCHQNMLCWLDRKAS